MRWTNLAIDISIKDDAVNENDNSFGDVSNVLDSSYCDDEAIITNEVGETIINGKGFSIFNSCKGNSCASAERDNDVSDFNIDEKSDTEENRLDVRMGSKASSMPQL